jgi:hypothetical protein
MAMEQFANNPQSQLAAGIDGSVTSLSVVSSTGFSTAPNFRLLVDKELMLVTGVSGTTFTVQRGIEATTATAHAAGAVVTQLLTAGALRTLRTEYAPMGVEAVTSRTFGTPPAGLSSIDSISLYEGERVLLVGYNDPNELYNGIWEAHSDSWTRPADFASGSTVYNGTDVAASYNADGESQRNKLNWVLNPSGAYPVGSVTGTPSGLVVDIDAQIWGPIIPVCNGVLVYAPPMTRVGDYLRQRKVLLYQDDNGCLAIEEAGEDFLYLCCGSSSSASSSSGAGGCCNIPATLHLTFESDCGNINGLTQDISGTPVPPDLIYSLGPWTGPVTFDVCGPDGACSLDATITNLWTMQASFDGCDPNTMTLEILGPAPCNPGPSGWTGPLPVFTLVSAFCGEWVFQTTLTEDLVCVISTSAGPVPVPCSACDPYTVICPAGTTITVTITE